MLVTVLSLSRLSMLVSRSSSRSSNSEIDIFRLFLFDLFFDCIRILMCVFVVNVQSSLSLLLFVCKLLSTIVHSAHNTSGFLLFSLHHHAVLLYHVHIYVALIQCIGRRYVSMTCSSLDYGHVYMHWLEYTGVFDYSTTGHAWNGEDKIIRR